MIEPPSEEVAHPHSGHPRRSVRRPHRGEGKRARDAREVAARAAIRELLASGADQVYAHRHLQVRLEGTYFHWVTGRAIRHLVETRELLTEARGLDLGSDAKLVWRRGYRYWKRAAGSVVELLNSYSAEPVVRAVGERAELLVLEGFARHQFVLRARGTASFNGRTWTGSQHNLDFIFERDGVAYGVEVKNTLPYMDPDEFRIKLHMCAYLGLKPLFACRALPKTRNKEVIKAGGYVMIFRYLLYPPLLADLAGRMNRELGLPVGTPRVLAPETMQRFLNWHERTRSAAPVQKEHQEVSLIFPPF